MYISLQLQAVIDQEAQLKVEEDATDAAIAVKLVYSSLCVHM